VGDAPQALATSTAMTTNASSFNELSQPLFQLAEADVDDLERQA
jgi:hypothetical protein